MLSRRNVIAVAAAVAASPAGALPAITDKGRLDLQAALLAQIEPQLAGVPMEVVMSVLAHLTAKFFAGISPTIRPDILTGFEIAVLDLIPIKEQQIGAPWAKKS